MDLYNVANAFMLVVKIRFKHLSVITHSTVHLLQVHEPPPHTHTHTCPQIRYCTTCIHTCTVRTLTMYVCILVYC